MRPLPLPGTSKVPGKLVPYRYPAIATLLAHAEIFDHHKILTGFRTEKMTRDNPNRRGFIKSSAAALSILLLPGFLRSQTVSMPKPTPAQLAWQACEVGIIYHFDLPIAARRFASNNTVKEQLDPRLYNPTKLDTDQWLGAATAANAKYAIFTATHFNGFMQWQSDLYPYGLKQASWKSGKGDVVRAFVESCHKAGIQPGLYFSTHRNAYWQVWDHYVNWGEGKGTTHQQVFNRIAERMTEELCSRYGPLIQIWYDAGVKTPGEGGPDVLSIFTKHQPNAVFYHNRVRADFRWIGNEHGYADYPCWATMPGGLVSHNSPSWKPILGSGDPEGTVWSPGMVDVPLRGANGVHNWFWNPDQDHAAHPTEVLVDMYYKSVGRNCNFIIGEVVTPEGLVPQSDIDRLAEFGREIRRRFKKPVGQVQGEGSTIVLDFYAPQQIDHIVLEEDIQNGERIREYKVRAISSDQSSRMLCSGQSIGHKRIHKIESEVVTKIVIEITKSIGIPQITMSVFRTAIS